MTRTIKLRFLDDNDYADVLVAMRPYLINVFTAEDLTVADRRAQAIAAICRAQTTAVKPPAAAGAIETHNNPKGA